MDFEQEIRFALVMYGGVSLAIYMNGVTQEFFHLVRATAVDEPLGTEETYRELAGIVRARFIADIASGTSAGGINAIFLAKALANGQSLDQLAQLWLDEADLSELWNKARAPKSLLSGPVMYEKLSRALDGMDRAGGSGPLQPEMDVFITATDLQGLELPIELSDMTVPEKRYKNVFHLSFDTGGNNDFRREMNPFLAFAARATSSFPFAFEPMRLADAGESPDPGRFFPAYVSGSGADYSLRAFGDGGYLNNKPFSYAISELPRRLTEFLRRESCATSSLLRSRPRAMPLWRRRAYSEIRWMRPSRCINTRPFGRICNGCSTGTDSSNACAKWPARWSRTWKSGEQMGGIRSKGFPARSTRGGNWPMKSTTGDQVMPRITG